MVGIVVIGIYRVYDLSLFRILSETKFHLQISLFLGFFYKVLREVVDWVVAKVCVPYGEVFHCHHTFRVLDDTLDYVYLPHGLLMYEI